jgi:hypothetical protein
MKLFAYKALGPKDEGGSTFETVKEFGRDGWELVAVVFVPKVGTVFYFKKDLPQ